MLKKVCIAVIAIIAVVHAIAGDGMDDGAAGIMMLLLALAGVVYGIVAVDAEDATAYCAVAIAVGLAAEADVLSNIHVVGEWLDAMLDAVPIALYSGVASILVMRAYNRMMG